MHRDPATATAEASKKVETSSWHVSQPPRNGRISHLLRIVCSAAVLLGASTAKADEAGMLTGDVRLACEAILCLAAPARPGECIPSLTRYFSINFSKPWKTVQERLNFLNLCPVVSQSNDMRNLASAIANGAGNCDAASLNQTLLTNIGGGTGDAADGGQVIVNNVMPAYCSAYLGSKYTQLKATQPVYVGLPERQGYWVDPKDYARALSDYNARIAAEDAAARQSNNGY